MTINILFPVLNERLRLESGIQRTMAYCKEHLSIPYTLTIIDNGSTDETPDIAKALCAQYPEVHYERLEKRGVGIAFRHGIDCNTSDIVGYMDIDLSTDIKYLGKAIDLFLKDPSIDYINGSRFSKESDTRGRKWYRKITSMGLVFLLKTQLHMKASDAVCGFTFMRKDIATTLRNACSDENGWFWTIEMLIRAERMGMNVYEMPVEWQEDYNTTVKIWKTIKNYLVQIYKLKKELNP